MKCLRITNLVFARKDTGKVVYSTADLKDIGAEMTEDELQRLQRSKKPQYKLIMHYFIR